MSDVKARFRAWMLIRDKAQAPAPKVERPATEAEHKAMDSMAAPLGKH